MVAQLLLEGCHIFEGPRQCSAFVDGVTSFQTPYDLAPTDCELDRRSVNILSEGRQERKECEGF